MSVANTYTCYTYTPLADPSQEIRIFKLYRSPDSRAVLTGTISAYQLPPRNGTRAERLSKHLRLPIYFALSYVWGLGPALLPNREIILDGRRFPITENLHTALCNHRSSVMDLRFWVDFICINQADDFEKSQQIPLMCEIFNLAHNVLVWLDDVKNHSLRVQTFVKNLTHDDWAPNVDDRREEVKRTSTVKTNRVKTWKSEGSRLAKKSLEKGTLTVIRGLVVGVEIAYTPMLMRHDGSIFYFTEFIDFEKVRQWKPSETQLERVKDEDLYAMADLIEKVLFGNTEYFNRMWTLQELCLAGVGGALLLSRGVEDTLKAIYYIQRKVGGSSIPSFKKFAAYGEISLAMSEDTRLPLRTLVMLSAGRRSQNPRDRIYALQGLMNDKLNPLLKPDYTLSVAEVYSNVARYFVFTDAYLDALCGQQLHDRIEGLPSWVPDFRFSGEDEGTLVRPNGENRIYHASLYEEHVLPRNPFKRPAEWQTLTVTGIFIDTIAVTSDISGAQLVEPKSLSQSEQLWVGAIRQHGTRTDEEQDAIAIVSSLFTIYTEFYVNSHRATFWTRNPDKLQYLRSLTGKMNEQTSSASALQARYILTLLCGRITTTKRMWEEDLKDLLIRVCIPDLEGIAKLEALCGALEVGMGRRHFAMGESMGAVPNQAVQGDVVCILLGCSVPVVLRGTDKAAKWEFVGECYWHGFMDGEALRLRDGEKVTAREFKLV